MKLHQHRQAQGASSCAGAGPLHLHRPLQHQQRLSGATGSAQGRALSSPTTRLQVAAKEAPSTAGMPSRITREARKSLFSPAKEQVTEVEASVSGTIPSWVEGALLANGGGDYSGMVHMFDGLAMMSKLRVQGGRVWASQRYIQSQQFRNYSSTGKLKWREFATPLPANTPMEKAGQVLENLVALATKAGGFTDNPSVNCIPLQDGSLMACSETVSSVYRVDPTQLSTLGQVPLASDGVAGDMLTAHPKLLRDGRTLVNFSRTLPLGGFHVFTQDTGSLKRKQIAFIRDQDPASPAWVHDFAVTERHAIILEMPIFINMGSLMLGDPREYIFMDWKPELGTRVHVVALDGSGVKTYKAPAFFTFHFANAYEEGGSLHVDFGGYKDAKILNDLNLSPILAFPGGEVSPSHLQRLTIPLGAAEGTMLQGPRNLTRDAESYGNFCEFPTINPTYRQRPYRYAYCLGALRPTNLGNALVKHDIAQGTAQRWHEPGSMPGEAMFVARPGATAEDDGVLLSLVMGADGASFLLVLDAQSLAEVARAKLPFGMPYRFHGTFLPSGKAHSL